MQICSSISALYSKYNLFSPKCTSTHLLQDTLMESQFQSIPDAQSLQVDDHMGLIYKFYSFISVKP